MTLAPVDWAIVAALLLVLTAAALYTRRHAQSVSGFLAANRCAGRYLISVAFNMAQLGVITLVWYFQQNYDVGYTSIWWQLLEGPALIVMALTGWVIYRFRQTRALTLAQFFEMRYSKRFRVFAGLVAFLSGIINYGIFPGVAARFFISLCGLPLTYTVAGATLSTTLTLMIGLMAVALVFLFLGGQIAVMVTDFLQGVFCNFVFLGVCTYLLWQVPWSHVTDVLLGRVWEGRWVDAAAGVAAPAGRSLIHPFKLDAEEQFNPFYWVISVVVLFYGMRAWQGDQGYNAAATTAHEARMANILNGWRFRVLMLVVLVLPISIRTMIHHPAYQERAAAVQAELDGLAPALLPDGPPDETAAERLDRERALRAELRTPLSVPFLLPVGLLGLFAAAMLGAFLSTNDTYLHSWGAIFVQDVVLPFRKRPLTPRQHLLLLKASIFGVAVFAVWFSHHYRVSQYISMYLALTGAVFVGGAGSAIIGGLYWRRGTTAAAWSAMIVGLVLSAVGIVVKDQRTVEWLAVHAGDHGPLRWLLEEVSRNRWLSGQVLTFCAILAACVTYVGVSLLGRAEFFDLDRMLHRGEGDPEAPVAAAARPAPRWLERLGFTREYDGADRWVAYVTLAWPLVWTVVFVVGMVLPGPKAAADEGWLAFWHGYTWVILVTGVAIMVWFAIGGFRNLRDMFRRLRAYQADARDDGHVERPRASD